MTVTMYEQMTERTRRVWSQGDFARAGAEQVIVGGRPARIYEFRRLALAFVAPGCAY